MLRINILWLRLTTAIMEHQNVCKKNKELYEMVIRLQDVISQLNYQINELQSILNGKDNELMIKVNDLLTEKIRIERSMNAKQYFAEKLLKDNERLKGLGKKIASRELDDDDDVIDGKEDVRNVTHEEEKRVDEDVLNARVEKMTREIREKDELIRSRDHKIVEIETKLQDSLKKSEAS
ncbi:uncharacterized protein LOC124453801 isoform X1 [Xenia sp. Carnegie-2017]|uniref:uncharacterized protein LOC124453801 isoform X1 n=1 Tax=Xenia sp. Carnegie-2017 TaxID=2897299 RepID=UPI001F03D204|nr:uncharacterized protein LOC124453801 isoform X1 [Xenia sp. Carnegie-2017]